jgi:hypothetical protein
MVKKYFNLNPGDDPGDGKRLRFKGIGNGRSK